MNVILDLAGKKFGRLVVKEKIRRNGRVYWNCTCDCGATKLVDTHSLTSGKTKSCKCLLLDSNRQYKQTHGASDTKEHRIWRHMRQRCENPNNHKYPLYGGRGITVCERWGSFETFISDMGLCPDGFSIERIDNDKGYAPDNCVYADRYIQANNRTIKNKTTGITGVQKLPSGRYHARINIAGRSVALGTFDTLDEASIVRQIAIDVQRRSLSDTSAEVRLSA